MIVAVLTLAIFVAGVYLGLGFGAYDDMSGEPNDGDDHDRDATYW